MEWGIIHGPGSVACRQGGSGDWASPLTFYIKVLCDKCIRNLFLIILDKSKFNVHWTFTSSNVKDV